MDEGKKKAIEKERKGKRARARRLWPIEDKDSSVAIQTFWLYEAGARDIKRDLVGLITKSRPGRSISDLILITAGTVIERTNRP